jgi:farnesyl-diphosphate farnesyltransferase
MTANVELPSGKSAGQENFPVGSFLIRPDVRPHVHAFYQFARSADDIADSATLASSDKLVRLAVMRDVLLGIGDTGSPSAFALRASLLQTGMSFAHAEGLLHAFRQDAEKTRYASWDELLEYCRYSAMPVGRYVLDLHQESAETWPSSDALCASLQILNHLQDVAKDYAALDRSYLPADMLVEAGAAAEDVGGKVETPALRSVFSGLLDHCDALNAQAAALPGLVRDRRLRLETAIIVNLAKHLTKRLRHGDPIATRVKLRPTDIAASLAGALRFLP